MPVTTRSGRQLKPTVPKNKLLNPRPKTRKEGPNNAMKRIAELHESVKNLIAKKLPKKTFDTARLSHLVKDKEELAKQGEREVKKFILKHLKTSDIASLASQKFIENQVKSVCEKVNRLQLSVSDSVKDTYILNHLKHKYKHLRKGTFQYLTKDEKTRATMFWTMLRMNVHEKDLVRFERFRQDFQGIIDSYFYLRKKACELSS